MLHGSAPFSEKQKRRCLFCKTAPFCYFIFFSSQHLLNNWYHIIPSFSANQTTKKGYAFQLRRT